MRSLASPRSWTPSRLSSVPISSCTPRRGSSRSPTVRQSPPGIRTPRISDCVRAWLALTDATAENGCMEFLPGSHSRGQLPHRAGVVAGIVNHAGQAVVGDVDDTPAVHAPLRAGEFSLHHTLCLHRSQPNRSSRRRIGLAISYIPTHVQHLGVQHKTPAMLVRGVDTFGHFELEPAPAVDLDETARAAYARSYDGYRAAYAEQVALERR